MTGMSGSNGTSYRPPLVTAAPGCGGTGPELARFGDVAMLPALMLGPVGLQPPPDTVEADRGSTLVERTSASLVYRDAPSLGVDELCGQWLPHLRARGARAVVAVRGASAAPLADVLGRMRRSVDLGVVTAVEVDLGDPAAGDPQHCLRVMSRARELLPRDVARHARFGVRTPDLVAAARHAVAGGASALVLSGAAAVGPDTSMSGPAVLPITDSLVRQVHEAIALGRIPPVPVIAVGGVTDLGSARRLLAAGADGVQVGTALFTDPGLLWHLATELTAKPASTRAGP